MGAAASAAGGQGQKDNEQRPEKMTEEQTTKFAQDMKLGALVKGEGGQKLLKSFKGLDGMVSSKSLLAVVNSSTEREIYMVFTQYSVGESLLMDNSAFVELLRDAKVLSKLDLTTHYANMIFKENATDKRINFAHFREVMVPLVARKKKMNVEDLLSRFCRVESRKVADAQVEKKRKEEEEGDRAGKRRGNIQSAEAHAAAKKLQKRTRQRHADRRITFMRQCSEAREDPMAVAALQAVNTVLLKQDEQEKEKEKEKEQEQEQEAAGAGVSSSARLQALFSRYTEVCSSHYEFLRSLRHAADMSMERKQFVLLCTDAKLINRTRFTISDCNEVFDKAIALAMNPASDPQHKADVFFSKRIGFSVFRDIAISCLAEKTLLDTQVILVRLLATPEKEQVITEKMNLDAAASIRSAGTVSLRLTGDSED